MRFNPYNLFYFFIFIFELLSWFRPAEAESVMSYPSIVEVDCKFCQLETTTKMDFNMNIRVYLLFKSYMARKSLLKLKCK